MSDLRTRPRELKAGVRRRAARAGIRVLDSAGGLGGAIVILALLMLVFAVLAPAFLSFDNLVNVLRQHAVLLILAVGQTLVIISRGIDLSVAATAALAGSVMGVAYAHYGLPQGVAILLGLMSGFAVGALNGLVITRWRVPDIIATLGTLTAVRGVALLVTGGQPVPDFTQVVEGRRMPPVITVLGAGSYYGIPLIIVVAVVCCAVGAFILSRTKLGRSIVAVGGNQEAAHVSGISVNRTKFLVYLISGGLAAVGGMMLSGRLASANAHMANLMELSTIAAVVIGGTALFGGEGRVSGTIIGVFIIGLLANGLNILGLADFWQRVATGLIIILVVALDQWRRRVTIRDTS
ncbi:ABC transporter permease [Jiangella aurantiaca]|uniref:Autoinducer 2 import system permease protein LsrD n=1 Tax=Jiangella aurantiaca TaxID=2530373 RepID=A0A4R5A3H5_9ACTN|nr:ABC transporter permease [Jiangella aurantiaca]TDD65560.1 ABC transporter permease [Jiangella aurantiaca]